jgi:hypothetical protein
LHRNIPTSEGKVAQSWLRNLKWMLMEPFFPELVVYDTWRQYVSARTLQNQKLDLEESALVSLAFPLASSDAKLNQKYRITDRVEIPHDGFIWSMVHGFYAGMGGFVFDLDAAFASTLQTSKSGPQRLTLTRRGIAQLANCGLVPDISRKEIDDKSKADGIAKTLVYLQAGWMLLQVVARTVHAPPITLPEVNTIGYVFCTFSINVLWWSKPRL